MAGVIIDAREQLDARQRMIVSAALLIREHGVEATSFSAVLAHSGAPRGSIYHHFPGGKAQLVEEATRYGAQVTHWKRVAREHETTWFRDDAIHLNKSGRIGYANAVSSAVARRCDA